MDENSDQSAPLADQSAPLATVLPRLPSRVRSVVEPVLGSWVGLVALAWAWRLRQIEIFDRSMAVAAQLFTAVFPTMILVESWFGGSSARLTELIDAPPAVSETLDGAVSQGSSTTFGVIGAIIVLASATSLSRALTRAYAAVWELPRPRSTVRSVWRWVAVVLAFVLTLEATRALSRFTREVPPPDVWNLVLGSLVFVAAAVFVPWVLLEGAVSARWLLPGAVIFGVVITIARPFMNLWLPHALEVSAVRYGSIGVAFTYLAWLYAIAWVFLAAAALGSTLVSHDGPLGRRLRGSRSA